MIISITVVKHVAITVRTPSTAVVGVVAAVIMIAVVTVNVSTVVV